MIRDEHGDLVPYPHARQHGRTYDEAMRCALDERDVGVVAQLAGSLRSGLAQQSGPARVGTDKVQTTT